MNRRDFIRGGATGLAAALVSPVGAAAPASSHAGKGAWPVCLNTGVIRPAALADKIRIAAECGYDAIELWVNELEDHRKGGGSLKALGEEIRGRRLFVPNVIGLWNCMPMDDAAWNDSIKGTRERMKMAAEVGSRHVAAIPQPDRADFDLKMASRRYRELLKMGREEFGIKVAFEFVGFFKGVYRFGQAAAVAIDADDPDACLIMDTFHMYRGGSGFAGLRKIRGELIANFHINDVPSAPPREELKDEHRVHPGDGILPLKQVLADLRDIGYAGPLSIETFNPGYWKMPPAEVARAAMQKLRSLMEGMGHA